MPWKLTVRHGPRVERERHDTLEAALEAAERRAAILSEGVPNQSVDLRYTRFEPGQQVTARVELAGPERFVPTVRAGIDVRGDGSSEVYVGRVRRELVKRRRGESAAAALRRTLEH
ncbi:MAG TPA: hypothetical protein VLP43_12495 [Solirubrobacteraceae bacterium]|nr:hypothetical protein [Solirubrobacteraceae bacterium]